MRIKERRKTKEIRSLADFFFQKKEKMGQRRRISLLKSTAGRLAKSKERLNEDKTGLGFFLFWSLKE